MGWGGNRQKSVQVGEMVFVWSPRRERLVFSETGKKKSSVTQELEGEKEGSQETSPEM